jgi:hypothetical protein
MTAKFFAQNAGAFALSFFLGLVGAAFLVAGLDTDQRARQATQAAIAASEMDLYQAAELNRAQSAKAEQRYKSGCFVMQQDTSLIDGKTYQFPQLSPGAAVCDRLGNAGIIASDGTVTDIVRTNNHAVIVRRLAQL